MIYRLWGKSGNLAVKLSSSVRLTFHDLSFSMSSERGITVILHLLSRCKKKKKELHLHAPTQLPPPNQQTQNPVTAPWPPHQTLLWWGVGVGDKLWLRREQDARDHDRSHPGLAQLTVRPFIWEDFLFLPMSDKLKRKRGLFGTIITRLFLVLYKNEYFHILWLIQNY